jgi:hypothetical protein
MRFVDVMVDAVLPEWPVLTPQDRFQVLRNCSEFVQRQLNLAPIYIRFGALVLFVAFRLYAILRLGPWPLTWCDRRELARALTKFSSLHLPMASTLERLFRSMTLLVFLEEPLVLAALGETTAEMRQAAFRAKRQELMKVRS